MNTWPWIDRKEIKALFDHHQFFCVYVARPQGCSVVKIGHAQNPFHMLRILRNHCHLDVSIEALTWCQGDIAAKILSKTLQDSLCLKGRHLRGPWYELQTSEVQDAISSIASESGIVTFTHEHMLRLCGHDLTSIT